MLLDGHRGSFEIKLSQYVIDQTRRVLTGKFPRHVNRFDVYMEGLSYTLVADPTFKEITENQKIVRDITDVPIGLAAMKADAGFLVSKDKDFLDLVGTESVIVRKLGIVHPHQFAQEVLGYSLREVEQMKKKVWRTG